jgi:hypothetical protein
MLKTYFFLLQWGWPKSIKQIDQLLTERFHKVGLCYSKISN